MKPDKISFKARQIMRRRNIVRRLVCRDKTPLSVLIVSARVGTLAGLVGVLFEKAKSSVQYLRVTTFMISLIMHG